MLRYVLPVLAACAGLAPACGETLPDAMQAALRADHRLAAAARQADAAAAGVDAARGLGGPQIAVEAGYDHLSDAPAFRASLPPLPTVALPIAEQGGWAYRAGITLPLYTGGRVAGATAAATAAEEAARLDVARSEQDVRLAAAEAYVGVLRAQRLLDVAERAVAALEAHRADVEQLHAHGLVARNDALAARSAAANAEQDHIRAATALALARAAYNRQLGRPLTSAVSLDDVAPAAEAADAADAATADPGERAEVAALGRQAEALRHEADAARGAALPQVVLQAGYDRLQNRYLVKDGLWSVGVGLRWTLFDGDVSRRQSDALAARAEAAAQARAEAQSQVELQVHGARLALAESGSRIGVAEGALQQAEENFRVARDRYQSGVGTNTEVLDAEALLEKSRSNHFNALYDHVLARQRLLRALGRL